MIEQEIEKEINLIIDRYLKLHLSFNDIKKYLTGNNIKIIIDELYELQYKYLKLNKNKNIKDFKNLIRNKIIITLKDRKYYFLDTNENIKNFKNFHNNI